MRPGFTLNPGVICSMFHIFSKRKQNTGDKRAPPPPESDIIYPESGNRDPGILGLDYRRDLLWEEAAAEAADTAAVIVQAVIHITHHTVQAEEAIIILPEATEGHTTHVITGAAAAEDQAADAASAAYGSL